MSTHLEFELDGTELKQDIILSKNTIIESVSLKLNILNNPVGNLHLDIREGVNVIKTITLTSDIINTEVKKQLGTALAYKLGYILFKPDLPINLRRNKTYTLALYTSGYIYSSIASFGWLKEYVNVTNKLVDVAENDLGNSFSYRLNGFIEYGGYKVTRTVKFFDGQQSAVEPDLGTLNRVVTGSLAAPVLVTAVGGIPVTNKPVEMIFINGDGGYIDITANPQVQAGTAVGQELNIYGGVNPVLIENGDGLKLNGAFELNDETNITLIWDGNVWVQSGSFGV